MRVARAHGLGGARGATGAVVVIDVLRAFTTAPHALAAGAEAVELVGTPAEGLARRREDPRCVLVGEVGGRPIPGFDHGNSPERMAALDLRGRRVVLRSSSGVQGALAALTSCERLFLGAFVTAEATVRALRAAALDVTLVAMGSPEGGGDEDEACAELLAERLRGSRSDPAAHLLRARASPAALQALDPAVDWITPGDLALALEVDRFGFALEARAEAGRVVARALHPPFAEER